MFETALSTAPLLARLSGFVVIVKLRNSGRVFISVNGVVYQSSSSLLSGHIPIR